MIHELVAKFENVKISQEALLPAEDIDYCKDQQQKLNETLQQLGGWITVLETKANTENNPAFEIKARYRSGEEQYVEDVYKYSYHRPDDANLYDRFKYSAKFGYIKALELRLAAKKYFISRIVDYFKEKYHLALPDIYVDNEIAADRFTDYKAIIDDIKAHLGHLDFRMVATENAIDEFRKKIYSSKNVELKGRILTLNNFVWHSGYGTPDFDFDFRKNHLAPLNNAIAIFERDHLVDPDFAFGSAIHGKDIDFTYDYPVINCPKIDGVRFFKNRKVQIKFIDVQSAKDFFNRFELSNFEY